LSWVTIGNVGRLLDAERQVGPSSVGERSRSVVTGVVGYVARKTLGD
jgi:hypothetical protein